MLGVPGGTRAICGVIGAPRDLQGACFGSWGCPAAVAITINAVHHISEGTQTVTDHPSIRKRDTGVKEDAWVICGVFDAPATCSECPGVPCQSPAGTINALRHIYTSTDGGHPVRATGAPSGVPGVARVICGVFDAPATCSEFGWGHGVPPQCQATPAAAVNTPAWST